jgi:hypothetical protein
LLLDLSLIVLLASRGRSLDKLETVRVIEMQT